MLTENSVEVRAEELLSAVVIENEPVVDLGVWLSGIESFVAAQRSGSASSVKEFELVDSALQKCSILAARILSSKGGTAAMRERVTWDVTVGELDRLSAGLRETSLLSEALVRSRSLGSPEWHAWSSLLISTLSNFPAYSKIIRFAEAEGEKYLPAPLNDLVVSDRLLNSDHVELALILPRFAKILRWLSVIGRMLERDEPLKPALLIFARVNEQIFELTTYINNRLERFPNEEAELFSSLDAASYTASIELKKVYSQELAGLAQLRPAPSIYARMETAHSLLSEGFQQILAGFARLLDPETDVFRLFPNFQIKREQSIVLREELASLAKTVQAAEQDPGKKQVEKLHSELRAFAGQTIRYLFYKDTETVERFIEEILLTKQNKDLIPTLHRFGAYLDTLSGQIALRSVLADQA